MKYHQNIEGQHDGYYCECGRWVTRKVVGFGPGTRIIAVDSDGSEVCS